MSEKRIVKGQVVGGTGKPITNAQIKFKKGESLFETKTDNNGNFSCGLPCDKEGFNYDVWFPMENRGQPNNDQKSSFLLPIGDGKPILLASLL